MDLDLLDFFFAPPSSATGSTGAGASMTTEAAESTMTGATESTMTGAAISTRGGAEAGISILFFNGFLLAPQINTQWFFFICRYHI
jgi:hypothetical protein